MPFSIKDPLLLDCIIGTLAMRLFGFIAVRENFHFMGEEEEHILLFFLYLMI